MCFFFFIPAPTESLGHFERIAVNYNERLYIMWTVYPYSGKPDYRVCLSLKATVELAAHELPHIAPGKEA